jgi:hypothetical protein
MRAAIVALWVMMMGAFFVGSRHANAVNLQSYVLVNWCESKEVVEFGMCLGYITGVLETSIWYNKMSSAESFCVPEDTSFVRIRDAVVGYVKFEIASRPSAGQIDARGLALLALYKAFPCPKIGGTK